MCCVKYKKQEGKWWHCCLRGEEDPYGPQALTVHSPPEAPNYLSSDLATGLSNKTAESESNDYYQAPLSKHEPAQSPADVRLLQKREKSTSVTYADPVDSIMPQPWGNRAIYDAVCHDHESVASPNYEDPTSMSQSSSQSKSRPTYQPYSRGYSTVFQSAGTYVPTQEERHVIFDGRYEVQHPSKHKHQYHKLCFFKDTKVYWAPASTSSGLYAQLSANRYREIPRPQIRFLEQIGSGHSAKICKALWECESEAVMVAIKSLKESSLEGDQVRFLQEAAIMGQFWHPNVIFLHGVVTIGNPCHIVMEYAPNADLLKYLKNMRVTKVDNQEHTQKQLLGFANEVASGMMYLAKKKFVHRDLAARNILLDAHMTCKIGDFGLTQNLTENGYYKSRGGEVPVKWTAPEALLYQRCSTASDVWSFGMLLYEMWSLGVPPFRQATTTDVVQLHNSQKGYCLPPHPGTPRKIYELMVLCWHPEAKHRPTFHQVYQTLCQPDVFLLMWSEEDMSVSPSANQLGADPSHSQYLYTDLQRKYLTV